MKKLFVIALLSVSTYTLHAQNQSNMDASANQFVELLLSNAIDITFTANNATTGPLVEIPFTTINDYVNGVESAEQQILVRSNKTFKVDVRANSANFTYTGSTTPAPTMPVAGVLGLKITQNNTGGTLGAFNTTTYATLRDFNQNLLFDGDKGANQNFSVKYRATPGFAYPAGNYSINVIYTATQY